MLDPIAISKGTVKRALERAEHYRLLNEPAQAESICLDVVSVDPKNQQAWIFLLLASTDQFDECMNDALIQAKEALSHLKDEYHQAYYEGIIHERWGRVSLAKGHGLQAVQGWVSKAMHCYQLAMTLAPKDDPDPTLRYNTCVRLQEKIAKQSPPSQPTTNWSHEPEYDEVPQRGNQ